MTVPTPEQLITAVTRNDWDKVRQYVKAGVDINGENSNRHTALLNAINADNLVGVALLIELGANPDLPKKAVSPLCRAIERGNIGMVKLFLSVGANANIRPYGTGLPPLVEALKQQKLKIAEMLLDYGANPIEDSVCTPLSAAIIGLDDEEKSIKLLLEYGLKNQDSETTMEYEKDLTDLIIHGIVSSKNFERATNTINEWSINKTVKKPTYGGKVKAVNKHKAFRIYVKNRIKR